MNGANIVMKLGCFGGGLIKGEETGHDKSVQETDQQGNTNYVILVPDIQKETIHIPWIIGAFIVGECLHDPFLV